MKLTDAEHRQLEATAETSLALFKRVAEVAVRALQAGASRTSDALANTSVNTLMSNTAFATLGRITAEDRNSYQVLSHEPAIARVVTLDTSGERHTIYICRATPPTAVPDLASYRAPLGRLAAKPIGAEVRLPNGREVRIIERAELHPCLVDQAWDSQRSVIVAEEFGPLTIDSLLAFLTTVPSEDLLATLLAEETQKTNVIEGVRRNLITKMGLRDQPILDQYQDDIFRLPLDTRLLLLGPPGTGKTTTLIRRLGQKLDSTFLDENEQRIIDIASSPLTPHHNSWLMFTPTDLLKQYLKEAFAREGVAASDLRIRTWTEHRRELARSAFPVLRTATGKGSFVLKEQLDNLTITAVNKPIEWFTDFNNWQTVTFLDDLRQSAAALSEHIATEIATLGTRLRSRLTNVQETDISPALMALADEVGKVGVVVAQLKDATDKTINETLNLQMNKDRSFIDNLAQIIDGLQQPAEGDGVDEELDTDEDETTIPRTGRAAAVTAYLQAVRAQARAHASNATIGKNTRNAKIIEWLGNRGLREQDQHTVGQHLETLRHARRFVNPVRRFLDGVPKRYRAFRRLRHSANTWYQADPLSATDLHMLELDLILLSIMSAANGLLNHPRIMREIEEPIWAPLKPMRELHKNQVLVDEATDFSPIQLSCMAAMAHPKTRSFFACGDFNQRLTLWGTRSIDEWQWIFPDLETRRITVSYRQSRQLNDLAKALALLGDQTVEAATLPDRVDNEGVSPALLQFAAAEPAVTRWIAERIIEIEQFVGQLPSIAIFVPTEPEVQRLANDLRTALADHNIHVVACTNGQIMGQDNDVRVFDVQYIKGLEFEAVFFVGIDRLSQLHPELFDKYLYVGATRAATYLGLSCDDRLPERISSLEHLFVGNWKPPIH